MTDLADFKQVQRLKKEVEALQQQLDDKRQQLATLSESLMERLQDLSGTTSSGSTTSTSRSRSRSGTTKRRSTKRISGKILQKMVGGGLKHDQLLAALVEAGIADSPTDAEAKVKGLLDRSDTPPIIKRGTTWKVNADYQEQRGKKGKRKRRK